MFATKNALNWRTLLLLALALVSALALALGYPGVTRVGAEPAPQDVYPINTITVRGFGQAYGAPDVAVIRLGVSVTNPDVGEAVTLVNETMTGVRAALLEAGVAEADLQTAGFNVWSEDRLVEPAAGAAGNERVYRAENMLLVTVRDIGNLEGVINAALEAGATNVFGLSFSISDTTALEREARSDALANAQVRAGQIAEELGVALGDPIIVDESYRGSMVPPPYATGLGGGAVIEEGQLSVSVDVTITFRMGQ